MSTSMRAGRPRRPDIQGLRAVAVLLVIVYHAGLHVPGGFTGVDVFFAISGFVIGATLVDELVASGRIHVLRFYGRRVRRLLPALALMVTVTAAAGTLASPAAGQHMGAVTGIFASIFGANLYLAHLGTGYFDVSTNLDPLLHTWTLGVEEQFYLVFPALLLLCWRVRGRAAAVGGIALVSACSFLLWLAVYRGSFGGIGSVRFAFYGSPTRAWEFGAGAVLALVAPTVARLPRSAAHVLGAAGAAAIAVGAFTLDSTATFPGIKGVLPVAGACALIAAGTIGGVGVVRLLGIRPAVAIGDLSYSLYLWHWPLIVFAKALWPGAGWAPPAAAAFSLVPAWLSYHHVENPIRFGMRLSPRAVLALAAVCVAVPLAASGALLATAKALDGRTEMKSWERSQAPHADTVRGCDSTKPLGRRGGARCTWSVPGSHGDVVLIGDSNAGHFTEAVVSAANRAGYDTTVATYGGCPFIALVVRPRGGNGPCYTFYVETMRTLLRTKPSLVILAARTDMYIETYGIGRPGQPLTRDTPTRVRLWQEGLTATLRRLGRAGIPVLVVHPIPGLPIAAPNCAVVRILTGSCAPRVSRSAVDAKLRQAVETENRAIAVVPSASAFDVENELCNRTTCSSARGGRLLYSNSFHLSVDGSRAVAGAFYGAILAHARPQS